MSYLLWSTAKLASMAAQVPWLAAAVSLVCITGSDRCHGLLRYTPEAEKEASRRWRDGSLEEDLPMRTLSEMFNVNYFLVSQTNPHIVPALNMKRKFNRKLGNLLETEWKHRWPAAICL